MTTLTPELLEQGLQLPPAERMKFANLLLGSLDGLEAEPDAELHEELQRRWDRYQSGEEPTYTLEETMAALRKQAADRTP